MIQTNNNPYIFPRLLLDFDLNGTIILQDTSKDAGWEQMLISVLAENTFDNWDGNHGIMAFKDYVYKILLPGDKSDQQLKQKRRAVVDNFLQWLVIHDHPAKNKVFADYKEIKGKFTNPITSQIEPRVFTSFYALLEKLKSLHIPFTMKLRTFGKDLQEVSKEVSSHPSGIKFSRWGNFSGQQISLEGEGTIDKVDKIFQIFLNSKEHFA